MMEIAEMICDTFLKNTVIMCAAAIFITLINGFFKE